ncbi:hypothetical protein [Roseomonas indoligenes]|uniref:Uncharacterized protein n=1 Tax=Roseomonas indoligenes TaxID=2820811 RepID=A0A940MYU4_9PROT|nr:hypothetical protein [Pararoseomonas indoligenes]MBP0493359.1 hypothetical protein [Pararoseomonas indoligenes]
MEAVPTPLKAAFAEARARRDMTEVLPVFVHSRLFVVAVAEGDELQLFITKSPRPDRMCVTVAESRQALARVPRHLVHAIDMERLLRGIVGAWDIFVMYPDGGDILHAEYLPDLRDMLAPDGTRKTDA